MRIDRPTFFELYRAEFGRIFDQSLVTALDQFCALAESDGRLVDVQQLAYVYATTKWETAHTFEPVEERGRGQGKRYGKLLPLDARASVSYHGRGFVQLTWLRNYARMALLHGLPYVEEPELAMRPSNAYRILVDGMRLGLFTGRRLAEYISGEHADYRNARRVVNGLDRADIIADLADRFERILRGSFSLGVV